MMTLTTDLLDVLGVAPSAYTGGSLHVHSPIDGGSIGAVWESSPEEMRQAVERADASFWIWRTIPAPKRGELVRLLGEELRRHKRDLGQLISIEVGKILSEGEGEVQEMIDICEFAVGLSRQLHGVTIASERPGHRMMEQWLPLGVVGVITAFNFPVAVWAWNAALALVCGNTVVWKPSEKTPLTALATQSLFMRAVAEFAARFPEVPAHLSQVLMGGATVGEALVDHPKAALISATGSTRMGRVVGPCVTARFGRCLLELGGNNAVIVTPSADLDLAVRSILFGAYGTAGQRCTTTRRVIAHESIHDELAIRLDHARRQLAIGDPLEPSSLVGPLIDKTAFDSMQKALAAAREQGGVVSGGERALAESRPQAWYVVPALARMPAQTAVVRAETFAPILYMMKYKTLDEAIALQNGVPQGLSSAIFTNDIREAETFMSVVGSDCGIVNVNIGTSGAEIGGAFGGEKETGGGRESGSDAWRAYMRRTTNTVNFSRELPLAQGVKFEI
jgi:aldehyde dehydrogenase (NAD+)